MTNGESDLLRAESGIQNCSNFIECNSCSRHKLTLSNISPGAERRGSRDPRVIIVTAAPDAESGQGTPYQGSTSGRMENFFTQDAYGVGLDNNTSNFSEFLQEMEFYATSAIKCCIHGTSSTDVSSTVISSCRQEYLNEQISAMPDLELILPMGTIAGCSILRKDPGELSLVSSMGRQNAGIIQEHQEYGKKIILMPHPSGASTYSNPPTMTDGGNREQWNWASSFRNALVELRETLDRMGYSVRDRDPDSWESPGGLSEY